MDTEKGQGTGKKEGTKWPDMYQDQGSLLLFLRSLFSVKLYGF